MAYKIIFDGKEIETFTDGGLARDEAILLAKTGIETLVHVTNDITGAIQSTFRVVGEDFLHA